MDCDNDLSTELDLVTKKLEIEIERRVSTQTELAECNQRYQQLLNYAPAGIYDLDFVTLQLTMVNDVICSYTGYSREELLNMNVLSLLTEESRHLFLGRLEMIKAGKDLPDIVELKIRAKGGREFWGQLNIRFKYKDKKIIGATVVIHDVDARKRAELSLKASEEKYRTILESIGEGYFEVDLAGNLTFFNDTVYRMLGYTRDEMVGMNNRMFTTTGSTRKMNQIFKNVYRTGNPSMVNDYEFIRKDGTLRYMELSTYLMRDPETENPIGFRGFVRDITARKNAEERRKKLEKKLQMAQKLESIGTLAGGIAHDFNNLMMSVLGNVSLMQYDLPTDHPHAEKLKNIIEQIQRGTKLTNQLLGYARKGRYTLKQIDLNHVIQDTSEAFGRTHKQIITTLNLKKSLPLIEADQAQIEQVLLNLYLNAADAMPKGGRLLIQSDYVKHTQIVSKAYDPKPGDYVSLFVIDEGIGMEEEVLARIFEPFFTTKDMGQGTGLGLASVYGIVKAHQGYINVDSAKGKGSTFSIYLPALMTKAEQIHNHMKNLRIGAATILIVDDEKMVLDISAQMLERSGFTVFKARGGQEALALYRSHQADIDLVILDMIMPDLGGGKTFDEMKKINPQVKVLLCSGYSLESEARKILERGCNGFIQKPFGIHQLTRKIEQVLSVLP